MLSIFVSGILLITYKYALEFVNPFTLYIIRTIGVAFFLYVFFRPKLSSINKTQFSLFAISAFLYFFSAVAQYFSIERIGVSMTTLILCVSPIITYLSSYFILKESITKNQILSSSVIIICLIIATLFA